jgi:AraC-like DNA-binding protein
MDLVVVGNILVSWESWSNKIIASGGTPPGYLVLAGPCIEEGLSWCGSRTDQQHLAYASDTSEVDFCTPDNEGHWTVLVPRHAIDAYLGDITIDKLLPDVRLLSAGMSPIRGLTSLIAEIVSMARDNSSQLLDPWAAELLESRLLGAVARFLLTCSQSQVDKHESSRRFLAYQRARHYAERLQAPISVEELSRKLGVCRRTLELGFREAAGISPQAYLRCARLNGVHRDLLAADPGTRNVTQVAEKWGFTELGRTAGYYRALFGVSPSETLLRDSLPGGIRFADILREPPQANPAHGSAGSKGASGLG